MVTKTGIKDKGNNRRKKEVKKHGYFLLLSYGIALMVTLLLSFILPKVYKSTATIFKPTESETSLEWLKASSATKGFASSLSSNIDLFLSILRSRSMQDKTIKKFDLLEVYHLKNMEEAREELSRCAKIGISKEKMITITVCDRDPVRAAAVANFYIENLDKTIQTLNVGAAKRNRLFIEERLGRTADSLNKAEGELKDFQIKKKIAASKDVSRMSEIAGELEGKLINAKLELEILKEYAASRHPEVLKLKNRINEIQKALVRLPPTEEKLFKLLRKIRSQETVYSFLTNQLEQAKIAEAKDTPVVQVLDYAIVSDKPYRPNLKLNLGIVSLVMLSLGALFFFFDALRYLGT